MHEQQERGRETQVPSVEGRTARGGRSGARRRQRAARAGAAAAVAALALVAGRADAQLRTSALSGIGFPIWGEGYVPTYTMQGFRAFGDPACDAGSGAATTLLDCLHAHTEPAGQMAYAGLATASVDASGTLRGRASTALDASRFGVALDRMAISNDPEVPLPPMPPGAYFRDPRPGMAYTVSSASLVDGLLVQGDLAHWLTLDVKFGGWFHADDGTPLLADPMSGASAVADLSLGITAPECGASNGDVCGATARYTWEGNTFTSRHGALDAFGAEVIDFGATSEVRDGLDGVRVSGVVRFRNLPVGALAGQALPLTLSMDVGTYLSWWTHLDSAELLDSPIAALAVADFANSAELLGVRAYDVLGNDVTAATSVRLVSGTTLVGLPPLTSTVPEPSTVALLAGGVATLGAAGAWRRRSSATG